MAADPAPLSQEELVIIKMEDDEATSRDPKTLSNAQPPPGFVGTPDHASIMKRHQGPKRLCPGYKTFAASG